MPKVKLKTNVIVGGQHLNRGSIVDDSILTPDLKTDQYITKDLDHKRGRVMLLVNVVYTSDQVDETGRRVGYPITLGAGEVIRLEEIPERQRADWKEGVEFRTEWSEKDRLLTRHKETESYMKQFQPDDAPLGIYDN